MCQCFRVLKTCVILLKSAQVVRFQCQGVLLIYIIVEQGPTVLETDADCREIDADGVSFFVSFTFFFLLFFPLGNNPL